MARPEVCSRGVGEHCRCVVVEFVGEVVGGLLPVRALQAGPEPTQLFDDGQDLGVWVLADHVDADLLVDVLPDREVFLDHRERGTEQVCAGAEALAPVGRDAADRFAEASGEAVEAGVVLGVEVDRETRRYR